ncbi:MAG: efflux RND transporter permease subunit, partial [Spirochaetia bacterium]|nr:efflux RND transporter permease subunit [Spirochaetia bacterium]
MPAQEMEGRIVTISERAFTTVVNDIEHMESQSMNGISVIKVFLQPGAKTEAAVAQLTSSSMTVLKSLPPGITPPLILKYSASDVPILQLVSTSPLLSEQELFDYSLNFIRTQLSTVQGASVPSPYGGKVRQIMVDLDMPSIYARNLTPMDVVRAVNSQNLILPSGSIKIGRREYNVHLNSSPELVDAMNDIPLGTFKGGVVTLRDVGQVKDGFAVQTNIVRENSRRGSLLTVLKSGSASTLDVAARVKETLPKIQTTLPESLHIDQLFDQSVFVRASVEGVVKEAGLAALLTALMILAFLGSPRSTLIVAVAIPLSMLGTIVFMDFAGQTLNVMTLGGLALAVGMLVDNATVVIENIHREMEEGKSKAEAVLEGTLQVGPPMLIATLAIMIVFVPILLLTGVSRSLFTPMAIAVVVSMAISFV